VYRACSGSTAPRAVAALASTTCRRGPASHRKDRGDDQAQRAGRAGSRPNCTRRFSVEAAFGRQFRRADRDTRPDEQARTRRSPYPAKLKYQIGVSDARQPQAPHRLGEPVTPGASKQHDRTIQRKDAAIPCVAAISRSPRNGAVIDDPGAQSALRNDQTTRPVASSPNRSAVGPQSSAGRRATTAAGFGRDRC